MLPNFLLFKLFILLCSHKESDYAFSSCGSSSKIPLLHFRPLSNSKRVQWHGNTWLSVASRLAGSNCKILLSKHGFLMRKVVNPAHLFGGFTLTLSLSLSLFFLSFCKIDRFVYTLYNHYKNILYWLSSFLCNSLNICMYIHK